MRSIRLIFLLFLIIFIIGSSFSTVIFNDEYNLSLGTTVPKITFNNTTQFLTIYLYNPTPIPTQRGLQVPMNVDWKNYAPLLNGNVSNVRIYNITSAIGKTSGYGLLPSWIEFNNSSNSNNSTIWVNLENTIIPPHGEIKIYMGFLNKTVSWNRYWGINSYLDGPIKFGIGDNGKFVFDFYDPGNYLMPLKYTGINGNGPSVTSSAPSPYYDSITGSVNGGSADATTWTTNGITNKSFPELNLSNQYIVQVKVYITGSDPLIDVLTNVNSSITTGPFYVFRFDARNFVNSNYQIQGYTDLIGYYPKGASSTINLSNGNYNITSTNVWYQLTAIRNGSSLELFKNNSGILELSNLGYEEVDASITQSENITGGGIAITTDGASSTDYWSLLIVRNYPPDGIMPLYNFGPLNSWGEFKNKINNYEDNITTTIYSQKLVASYIDQNGVVYWVDSYGDVFVNYSNNGAGNNFNGLFELSSLRSAFSNAPFIDSIAVVNLTMFTGYNPDFVILLSKLGYVYAYNITNSSWINATKTWNLNLNKISNDWVSVSFTSSIPYTKKISRGYYSSNVPPLYLYFADSSGAIYTFQIFPTIGSALIPLYVENTVKINSIVTYSNVSTKGSFYNITFGLNANSVFILIHPQGSEYLRWVTINNSISGLSSLTIGDVKYNNGMFNRLILLTYNGNLFYSIQNVTNIYLNYNNSANGSEPLYSPFILVKTYSSKSSFFSISSQADTNSFSSKEPNGNLAFSKNASILFSFTMNFSYLYIIEKYNKQKNGKLGLVQEIGSQSDQYYPVQLYLFTINSTLTYNINITFQYLNSSNLSSLTYINLSYSNLISMAYFINYSFNYGLSIRSGNVSINRWNNASFFATLLPMLPYNAYIRLMLLINIRGNIILLYNVGIKIINYY